MMHKILRNPTVAASLTTFTGTALQGATLYGIRRAYEHSSSPPFEQNSQEALPELSNSTPRPR